MRTNVLGLVLVVVAVVSATFLVGAAPPPRYDDVTIKFEHWTPEMVVFIVTFDGRADGAGWEAMLAQGEHITERQGAVPTEAWRDLAARVEAVMPDARERAVRDDEERWVVTFTRGGVSRVARFAAPASRAEKQLLECFGHGSLPRVIYQDFLGH